MRSTVSLLFPDRLDVVIEPDSLAVSLRVRDWRGRESVKAEVLPVVPSMGEPDGAAAIVELEAWLRAQKWRSTNVRVSVTDQFSHYCVVSWPVGVFKRSELQLIVEGEIEQRLGIDMASYEVRTDVSRYGTNMLACAMPRGFLAGLKVAFTANRLSIRLLQPRFVDTFNRWKKEITQDGLLVSVESDRCVLGVMQAGQWHSVRTLRVASMNGGALSALIEREQVLHGMAGQKIYMHLHGKMDARHFAENENVQLLGRGMSPRNVQQVIGGGQ